MEEVTWHAARKGGGGRMDAAVLVSGTEMSWDQYRGLPADVRAEYSDGQVYMTPGPGITHQRICSRLDRILFSAFGPAAVVVPAGTWHLPGPEPIARIPDLLVLSDEPVGDVFTGAPALVVEVLSSDRARDLVVKRQEYLAGGAGQYWIVDPRERTVTVLGNRRGGWETLAALGDATPSAVVDVAPFGTLTLSLTDILG
jgi:Uma2 family endonuclease